MEPRSLFERAIPLAWLEQGLAGLKEGRGGLLLIAGEAGAGKSSLVRAFLEQARSEECRAGTGYSQPDGATPFLGPILAAVYPGRWDLDGGALVAESGGTVSAFTYRVCAEWKESRSPILLLLEDLHWADEGSVDFLRFAAPLLADHPVLIVGTYRTEEVKRGTLLWDVMPHLQRSGARQYHLHSLSREAVMAMIGERIPARAGDQAFCQKVHHRTSGLPLFVQALLNSLEATGAEADAPLPDSLQQVIDGHLARLGPDGRSLIEVAAVVGERFRWPLLHRVLDWEEERLEPALEEALEERVLVPADQVGEEYRFQHELVREAVLTRVVGPRRRRWHGRVAEALLAEAGAPVERLAHHLLAAGDPRGPEYLFQSAVRTAGAGAVREAQSRFQQVLNQVPDPHPLRPLSLLALGELQQIAEAGFEHRRFQEAESAARAAGDEESLWWARRLEYSRLLQTSPIAESLSRHSAQRETLLGGPGDPDRTGSHTRLPALIRRPSMAAHHAHLHAFAARPDAFQQAADHLRQTDPTPAVFEFLARTELFMWVFTGQTEPAVMRLEQVLPAVYGKHHWVYGLLLQFMHGYLHLIFYAEDPTRVDSVMAQAVAREQEVLARSGFGLLPDGFSFSGFFAWMRGEWERARHHLVEIPEAGYDERSGMVRIGAALHLVATGDPERAARLLVPALPPRPYGPMTVHHHPLPFLRFLAAVQVYLALGQTGLAHDWAETAAEWASQGDYLASRSTVALARALVARAAGDEAGALAHAREAAAAAGAVHHYLDWIPAERLTGELLAALGEREQAEDHLEQALSLAERCRFPFETALTELAWAEALPDHPQSSARLAAARDWFAAHGATPAQAQADRLLQARRHPPAPRHPDALTPREWDVARLVAEGLADKEIGSRLNISARTVDGHLRHIFGKLDLPSRSALTAWILNQTRQ